MSIFEKASRLKLRFETSKGALTAEDLWDLPLQATNKPNLDDLARELYTQVKGSDAISFVNKTAKPSEALQLRFDLVKHVIDTRLTENAAKEEAELNKQRKARILALIEEKENNQLGERSLEELRALANAL